MKKRLLLTLLTIVMAIALTPIMAISVSASTHNSYENGICTVCGEYQSATLTTDKYDVDDDGNFDSVYEIENAGQLYWFAKLVNDGDLYANAVLTDDIVINKDLVSPSGELNGDVASLREWIPIGLADLYGGNFDGNNHTVSGIYTRVGEGVGFGLFGFISRNTVRNVGVIDSYIENTSKTSSMIGGIAGYSSEALVQNCFSDVVIVLDLTSTDSFLSSSIGGIVGQNSKGTVDKCYFTGTIKAKADSSDRSANIYPGGIVGFNPEGVITNSYASGSIDVQVRASSVYTISGGVVAYNYDGHVENAYSTTTITTTATAINYDGDYSKVGKAVGSNYDNGTVVNVYALGEEGDTLIGNDYNTTNPAQVTAVSEEELKSGKLALLLGESFGQSMGSDNAPVFATQENKVYYGYVSCAEDAVMVYTNDSSASDTKPDHQIDTTNGYCTDCGVFIAEASFKLGEQAEVFYKTLGEAIAQAATCTPEQNAVVKVYKNVTVTEEIASAGSYTLDINGQIIENPDYEEFLIKHDNGTLTLTDGLETGALKAHFAVMIDNGTLNLTYVTVQGEGKAITAHNSTVNLLDGADITAPEAGIFVDNSILNVIGGKITSVTASIAYLNPIEIKVSGGTIIGPLMAQSFESHPILTGGNFPSGIYSLTAPIKSLLADGYVYYVDGVSTAVPDEATELEGNVTVALCDHTSFSNETGICSTCGNFVAVATLTIEDGLDIEYFITLQDAVDKAQTIAGSKITLLCDIELSHWVEITSGEFTIDFADKFLGCYLTNTALNISGGNITLIGIGTDMHIDLQTIVYGGNVTAIDVIFNNLMVDGGSLTYENCKAEYIFFYSGSLKLKSGGVKCLYIEEDSGKTPVDVLDKDSYFYNEDTLTDASKIELDSYNEYKITNFNVKKGANLSEYASVELEYTQAEYTGSQLTPNATVKVSGITVDPANYEVVYTDNVGVGTATVTVNAIGEFYSGSISTSFEITKATPKYSDFDIVLTNGGHGTYDGNVWEATVTAKAGVIGMGEITVKYYDALGFPIDKVQNVGHYTAFVDVAEGTNYNAITDIFISDIDVSSLGVSEEDFTVTGLESEYVYSGESINPEITVILFGKTLEKDKDYELLYSNDKNVGEYQFNLLIGGNYYGSFTYDYKIVQATPVIELTLPAHSLMPSNRMAITATSNAKEELAYAVVDGEGYSVDPSDPMVIIVDADALIGTTLTVTVQNLETANYAVGFKTVEVAVVSNEVDLSGIEQDIEDLNTLIAGKADSTEITLKLQEINGKIQLLEDNGATDLELTTAKEELTNALESALANAVTQLEGKIDAQVDPTELATAIDGVEALIGAIPAEYVDVADYVAKVKTALESALANAVTQLEGKIDAQVDPTELENAIDGVEALIGAIPAEYVDVADYVAKVKTALESALANAVTELENADKQNADALTKAVADFNKLIGVIPTEYADVATYVASVKSTIEKALNEKVAELKATDSQLQNAINTNSDSISNLTDQLANRYAELKALVGELPDGVASVKDYVDGINQALESADSTLKLAIEKVATDLENAQAELESAIKQGDSELSAKIEEVSTNLIAVENALKLADKAIKEEFNGKIESAKTTLNNAINAVQQNLDKAKLELQISIAKNEKVLSDKITALNEALNEATALLQIADENLKNELTAKIDEVNTTLESAIKAVQKNLDKAKEELENSIANGDEALSTRISDLSDALKDAISVLQKADDSLKSKLTEKIETVNAILENAIKMVEKHLDEAKLELENAIKQGDGELDDKITNLSDALTDAINTLEIADASNKDALLTKINEVYSTLDSAIKAVQKNLDDKTQMLEKSIASNKLVLDEKYNELKTFTIVVCVVSGVALLGSSAFVIWFFINRRKR